MKSSMKRKIELTSTASAVCDNKKRLVPLQSSKMADSRDYMNNIYIKDDILMESTSVHGCRNINEFQYLDKIGEGAYGTVYRAREKISQRIVAIKACKIEKDEIGFPITYLREIKLLLQVNHPNIISIIDVAVNSSSDKFFIVLDYVEHEMKSFMDVMKHNQQTFLQTEVKCLMQQLLSAVAYLHNNWILHRDLKPSNLLINGKGILKVSDFGMSRQFGLPAKAYTPTVVTLWYRAPEILSQVGEYSTPVDMWSVGCIFGEFLRMEAILRGESEIDQLKMILRTLSISSGIMNHSVWLRHQFPMLSEFGLDFLGKLLMYNPKKRITADDSLRHKYFSDYPLPIEPSQFPLVLGTKAKQCFCKCSTFSLLNDNCGCKMCNRHNEESGLKGIGRPQEQFESSFILKF